MEVEKLEKMIGGWFIGNFKPSILSTSGFEVAVKRYAKGDFEPSHFHKVATEYTVILDGEVEMNGAKYSNGDIIIIKPLESTDFYALTDVKTVVVKVPSVSNDKFLNI